MCNTSLMPRPYALGGGRGSGHETSVILASHIHWGKKAWYCWWQMPGKEMKVGMRWIKGEFNANRKLTNWQTLIWVLSSSMALRCTRTLFEKSGTKFPRSTSTWWNSWDWEKCQHEGGGEWGGERRIKKRGGKRCVLGGERERRGNGVVLPVPAWVGTVSPS